MKKMVREMICILVLCCVSVTARAAVLTWLDGGADNLASNPSNWAAERAPQAGDEVVFAGTATQDCEWDIETTLRSLTTEPAYTGTISLTSSLSLSTSGNVVVSGGRLILSDHGALDIGIEPITPVYVTFYSHNEEGMPWNLYESDPAKYEEYRADLVARIRLLDQYGGVLNWETTQVVLGAMSVHETGDLLAETNGKNVLRWMTEDMGMVVDPHGHQQVYSYADIAYEARQLGVEVSGVAGGFLIYECGENLGELNITDWESVLGIASDGLVHGNMYPGETWQPTVLAEPAMAGHVFDEFSSGIWRPGSGADFFTPQTGNELPYIGQGYPHDTLNLGSTNSGGATVLYSNAGYVKELVQKIADQEVPSGVVYTASIHLRDVPNVPPDVDSTYDGLQQILEELAPFVRTGQVVYLDYQSVADLWLNEYGGQVNRLEIDQFSVWPDLELSLEEYCWNTGAVCGSVTCQENFVCEPDLLECVADCRLSPDICPVHLPVCDNQTGLCLSG